MKSSVAWAIVAAIAMAGLVVVVVVNHQVNTSLLRSRASPNAPWKLLKTPVRIPVLTEPLIAAPLSYNWFTMHVPAQATNAVLKGHFRVTGGLGNDIRCFVTDTDGLENFRNGHRFATYFDSGTVTAQTLRVRLDPGIYYLVFSNRGALFSNKVINGRMEIEYEN